MIWEKKNDYSTRKKKEVYLRKSMIVIKSKNGQT